MAIANETIDGRPECIAYIAGRVFYGLDSVVYYTQLLEGQSLSQLDKCYQLNDPTAEQISDILATDGGTIPINGADRIVQLVEFLEGVLVFANNGVWSISGPEGGFKATDFNVKKLTNEGIAGANTVVNAEGSVLYWAKSGIYQISQNQYGIAQPQNITFDTIQTFYENIPDAQKSTASGYYVKSKKMVEWLYCDTNTKDNPFVVNKGLVLDLRVGGWFINQYNSGLDYSSAGTYKSLIAAVPKSEASLEEEVLYMYANYVVGAGSTTISYGFATKTDSSYQDFGVNYPTAYLETGYEALGKPSNKKTAPYLMVHFQQTEQNWVDLGGGDLDLDNKSSCNVSTKWDWNDTDANGRFGPSQEAYKFRRLFIPDAAGPFNSGETVISNRIKVRGRGNSVSIRFEQTAGQTFELLGYTIQYSMKGRI